MSRTLRIAVIAGDGIGPEVVAEGLKVLDAVAPSPASTIETHRLRPRRASLARHRRDAARLRARRAARARRDPARRGRRPVGAAAVCSSAACCCGCGSSSTTTSTCGRCGCYPGVATPLAGASPATIDMVVVREGTEGPYAGAGGVLRRGHAARGRHRGEPQHRVRRRAGRPRRVRPGARRGRGASSPWSTRPTCSSTPATCGADVRPRSATEFPDVAHRLPATSTRRSMFFVTQPERFDVVVTDNLFGDILTDLGAAIAGGIGLAASGNLDVSRTQPEHVRAGARLGAGHRRPGQGRPDGHRPVASRCCWTTWACRGRRTRSRPRSPPTWRGPAPVRAAPRRSATRSPPDRLTSRGDACPTGWLPCVTDGEADADDRQIAAAYRLDHAIALKPTSTPLAAGRARRRSWPTPASAGTSPTTWSRSPGTTGRGWHDAQLVPYAPLSLDPADHGAALRPGDLRGAQGLPPGRRLDRDLPAGAERPALPALRPARWPCPSCPKSSSSASIEALVAQDRGLGAVRRREQSCTCARSCSPPRSASACARPSSYLFVLIASPAGAYFPRGVKPVTVWLSEDYTRAAPGGTGEAKCAGNYAASLVAQAQAAERGLRPGRVARRRRAPLGRGDGRA